MQPGIDALAARACDYLLPGRRTLLARQLRRRSRVLELRRTGSGGVGPMWHPRGGGVRRVVRGPHRGVVCGASSAPRGVAHSRVGAAAVLETGRAGFVLFAISVAAVAALLSRRSTSVPRNCDGAGHLVERGDVSVRRRRHRSSAYVSPRTCLLYTSPSPRDS